LAIYSDLNFHTPRVTPLLTDEQAVYQAIDLLFETAQHQRFFHPEIYADLASLLFEPMTADTEFLLFTALINAIERFEPRVVIDVSGSSLVADYPNSKYDVELVLQLKGLEQQIFEYTGILQQHSI